VVLIGGRPLGSGQGRTKKAAEQQAAAAAWQAITAESSDQAMAGDDRAVGNGDLRDVGDSDREEDDREERGPAPDA